MELDLEAKEQFEQKFKMIALLGKGSFGEVYECEDKSDGQVFAVKVIPKNNVKKSKLECLREQAKLLSTIDHPNIVKLYQFGETNNFIYLKMELVRNGTLDQLIKRRWSNGVRFSDQETAAIMGALMRGVNHIHSVSIIHRDIKPDNILLPNQNKLGQLKIADFGLSTKLDFHYPKTATSKCGTMLYMAPQILCNFTYTKSVDVWSCAIIMHLLVHGKHPLHQPKMSNEQYKRKIKGIKFSPFADKMAQDFFARISKIESAERYTTQEALKHPWLTRKFDDPIPLSLHESFSGFQKSHEISQMVKGFLALRQLARPNFDFRIPENYLAKKDYFVKQNYAGLTKSKSKQSSRDLNSLSGMNVLKDECQAKPMKTQTELDSDNPAILKLNSIFNSLFGKRSRHQLKTFSQGMIVHPHQPKQNTAEMPDIADIKQKIEIEIERAVQEFKNGRIGHKRILPKRQTPAQSDKYIGTREELKAEQKGAPYKIRFRKKTSASLRLYD